MQEFTLHGGSREAQLCLAMTSGIIAGDTPVTSAIRDYDWRISEFVPRDQVSPLIVVYCLLPLLKNKSFQAGFIPKNCSGQFLSAYFLFREILNLNLTFAVNVTLNLSIG